MTRSPQPSAGLKPYEMEMLQAMADEGMAIDVELASCFLAMPRLRAITVLDRLEHRGLLIAHRGGTFSLNRAAYNALVPAARASNGHRHYR